MILLAGTAEKQTRISIVTLTLNDYCHLTEMINPSKCDGLMFFRTVYFNWQAKAHAI
jgi:hypothetical protein